MEAWRQWRLGGKKLVHKKNRRIDLTPTGLLMEGHYTNYVLHTAQCKWPNSVKNALDVIEAGLNLGVA